MNTDVIIVGGGLVGGTLARALGLEGRKVVVVDAAAPCTELAPDRRTTAVSAGSQKLLARLGVWSALTAGYITPIEKICVGDAGQSAALVYDSHTLSPPEPVGYMVSNYHLRHAIYEVASTTEGVTWLCSHHPRSLSSNKHEVRLETDQGTYCAPLIIGADGKRSWVRDQLKIKTREWRYNQDAMIGVCKHPEEHHNVAVEWFTPHGPLALLPMSDRTTAIVWSLKHDKLSLMKSLDDTEAMMFLNNAFQDHRGPLSIVEPRQYYPLDCILPYTILGPRACLMGDAAHCIHPVAGQGVNVGFRDIEGFISSLAFAKSHGLDIGSHEALRKYERSRRLDRLSMTLATDGVVRLFSNNLSSLKIVRGLGLRVVNRLPFLRQRMMRHAMGYSNT